MVNKKYEEFVSDLIILGDLPDRKKNAKNFTSGLIVLRDLPDDKI
jgi:hypothetical protein